MRREFVDEAQTRGADRRSDLVQKALQFIAIEETQAGLLKAHDVPATRC